MKFLFLSRGAHLVWDPAAPRAAGGAELQAALMACELAQRGHHAVLLGADTGQPDGAEWNGIRIRNGGHYETGKIIDTLQAWPRIHAVLREERPDYVVVYGWTSLLYLLAWWRRIVPFKLVFVCALDAEIDGEFRRRHPARGALFERGMRAADARLSITAAQADDFARQFMSCTVTRLLLAHEETRQRPSKIVDLLWVARCEEVKRPHLFLDLAEHFPMARCRMICAPHDRALWNQVRERAASLPQVEFLEGVPYREIQYHFDEAKIFVNTSSHEGVPNTFTHAGLGRAAIISLEIDPDGMFSHFPAGFLAHGDDAALVDAVGRLLRDPEALSAAGAGSARFVAAWHDNKRNVDAFLQGVGAA